MDSDQQFWQNWAKTLQHLGIHDWVASILEAAGPLTVLGAQIIYIGQPLFRDTMPYGHLDALARLLEDTDQTQAFASFLREGPS